MNFLQEFQFLYYLIAVTLGVQLSIYFFYQYFKIQDVNMRLNRILLSFGAFTLLTVFGAFCILITRLFELDLTLEDVLYRTGFSAALLSPVGFMACIMIEEFSSILNIKLSKILIGLNLIPIAFIWIFSSESMFFRVSIVLMVLSALNCVYVQVKLIKRTLGDIRRRITQFFVGELFSLSALIFALQVSFGFIPFGTPENWFFLGTSLLIIGFLTMFVAVNDFPPFYEFEWQLNLIHFLIINQRTNICLYSYIFHQESEEGSLLSTQTNINPDMKATLFSGGISGINAVISGITDTTKEKINKIKQENSDILLDYGVGPSYLTYALVVKKDIKSANIFLKSLKYQFETFFKQILIKLDSIQGDQNKLFSSFDIIVYGMLK